MEDTNQAHLFEVEVAKGNQVILYLCNELTWPKDSELFLILRDVVYPPQSHISHIYIPKHLIQSIKKVQELEMVKHSNVVTIGGKK